MVNFRRRLTQDISVTTHPKHTNIPFLYLFLHLYSLAEQAPMIVILSSGRIPMKEFPFALSYQTSILKTNNSEGKLTCFHVVKLVSSIKLLY